MTTHLDDEQLVEWAMGGGQTADAAAADHLQLCARCRESLAALRAVAELTDDLPRLERPPADVWQRVRDDLDLGLEQDEGVIGAPHHTELGEPASEAAEPRQDSGSRATSDQRPSSRFRRRSLALAASVAAVLGIGAGVGGTLLLTSHDDKPAVEAVIRLEPLQGKTGDGSADLVRSGAGNELKVAAAGLDATSGFYEVWLINTDGKRMVSLGVLNPRAGGTFQIPAELTTQGYRIVDISLEPDDGNPEHSHDSIIRGTLPT